MLKNRSLTVVDHDKLLQTLISNKLSYSRNTGSEVMEGKDVSKDDDLTKQFHYTKIIPKYLKNRWSNEYLKELREHHQYSKDVRKVFVLSQFGINVTFCSKIVAI